MAILHRLQNSEISQIARISRSPDFPFGPQPDRYYSYTDERKNSIDISADTTLQRSLMALLEGKGHG